MGYNLTGQIAFWHHLPPNHRQLQVVASKPTRPYYRPRNGHSCPSCQNNKSGQIIKDHNGKL